MAGDAEGGHDTASPARICTRRAARSAQGTHAGTARAVRWRMEAIPRLAVSATVPWGHPCPGTARKESAMLLEQVLYQAQVTATGGREGRAVSSDGVLDVQLTTPRELGGAGRRGTNPEQLFAAGYAASFLSAMQYVAARDTLAIPPEI